MIFGYCRVSTQDQTHDLQLDALKAAGVDEIITDTISGGAASRPGLDRLLDKAREGDTIVVWRLDRLARSLSHLIALVEQLKERGIALKSLHEDINTGTANGRLILHIFGALAQFEKELTHERVMSGLAAAKAKGKTGGRPPALTEEQKRMIQTLADDGISRETLATQFNVSRATIFRVLKEVISDE